MCSPKTTLIFVFPNRRQTTYISTYVRVSVLRKALRNLAVNLASISRCFVNLASFSRFFRQFSTSFVNLALCFVILALSFFILALCFVLLALCFVNLTLYVDISKIQGFSIEGRTSKIQGFSI